MVLLHILILAFTAFPRYPRRKSSTESDYKVKVVKIVFRNITNTPVAFDMINVCPILCLYYINNEKQNTYLADDKYVIRTIFRLTSISTCITIVFYI